MENDLGSLFAAADSKKVAEKRASKTIEKTQEQVLRDFLASDFWKFIYTSRNIAYNAPSLLADYDFYITDLDRVIDEEGYALRCAINAMSHQLCGRPYEYDLDSLSLDEASGIYFLLQNAVKYGYYLWDVRWACRAEEIVEFFIKYNYLPLPPLPFGNSEEQKVRHLTFRSVVGMLHDEIYCNDVHGVRYVIDSSFNDADIDVKLRKIKFYHDFHSIHANLISTSEPLDEEYLVALQRDRKIVIDDGFQSNSNAARCIGLWMHDEMIRLGCEEGNAVDIFKKSDKYEKWSQVRLFHGSTNPYLSDKDNGTLKRWLRTTIRCVESMSVLSFK